ncbi:Glycosyltransferase 2 [Operophtera brumata]|uniref:Glycosyltransferase 2 n=1 Tax=Operophtera brumata TaxID=104452 RepID=A0A0L7LCV6_OPEBR|nr:Glycosyltransferase 2 [Operophtera brumata]
MPRTIHILVCVSLVLIAPEAARILAVVPTPSISHQVVFRPLTQELAKRGHDVTIITTDPVFPKGQTPENLTEIDLHDMSYKVWRNTILSSEFTSGNKDIFQQMEIFTSLISTIFEKQMEHPEVKKVTSNETKYDLLILELWVRPALLLSHVFKDVPVIAVSSFGCVAADYDIVGAPTRPTLLYPTLLRSRIVNLNLWEKVIELYINYVFENIFASQGVSNDILIKKILGPDTPNIKELEKNIDMLFLNLHPIWEINRPSTDEAITAGVPLIGMPMLADQFYNVEQSVLHEVGVRVDMDTLAEDTFLNAINTVIDDKRCAVYTIVTNKE